MSSPIRVIVLALLAVGITAGLSYLDSDRPSDTLLQRAQFTFIIFVVACIFYAGGCGLMRALRRR